MSKGPNDPEWRKTQEFIDDHTMPDHPHVKPQIPNFVGKQSAINWAKCHKMLPQDTKDADIKVYEMQRGKDK